MQTNVHNDTLERRLSLIGEHMLYEKTRFHRDFPRFDFLMFKLFLSIGTLPMRFFVCLFFLFAESV